MGRADRELALEAVRQEGWALRYVSEDLRSDDELVRLASQTCQLASEKDASSNGNGGDVTYILEEGLESGSDDTSGIVLSNTSFSAFSDSDIEPSSDRSDAAVA